jgi:type IV secretion system protein VirB5
MKLNWSLVKIMTITLLTLPIEAREASAILSVVDSDNLANSVKQVAAWKQQLEAMQRQIEQNIRHYEALTGTRGLGRILHDAKLYNNLPAEYKSIYNKMGGSNYGIEGAVIDIINAEKPHASIADMQKDIEERSMRTAAINKAIGLKGYEGIHKRLSHIEALMDRINDTEDPKSISELQARIALEQALIQNESNKLQMISQLQRAELNLIREQKREMSRRLLNSKNTKMPRIK